MFVKIDETVDRALASSDPNSIEWLDDILQAHRLGHVILLLTREQIIFYRGLPLGRSESVTLTYISNKLNEYNAAAALSDRILLARLPASEQSFRIIPHTIPISFRLLSGSRLATKAFLLAENLSDVRLLRCLADLVYTIEKYPVSFVNLRAVSGGGSTLADVLEGEEPSPLKGIVICDRDTVEKSPPFKAGTTAHHAYARACALNLIRSPTIGWSCCSPMFSFDATWGRTIESCVGPHLLDTYFEANNRRTERTKFTNAFPDFPTLKQHEIELWGLLNLKDGTKPSLWAEILDLFRSQRGGVPAAILPRSAAYSKLSMPNDVMTWVTENAVGRYKKQILAAFVKDLRNRQYGDAIERIAKALREVGAGDRGTARM